MFKEIENILNFDLKFLFARQKIKNLFCLDFFLQIFKVISTIGATTLSITTLSITT